MTDSELTTAAKARVRRRSELRRQAAAEGRNLSEEFRARVRAEFETGAAEARAIVRSHQGRPLD